MWWYLNVRLNYCHHLSSLPICLIFLSCSISYPALLCMGLQYTIHAGNKIQIRHFIQCLMQFAIIEQYIFSFSHSQHHAKAESRLKWQKWRFSGGGPLSLWICRPCTHITAHNCNKSAADCSNAASTTCYQYVFALLVPSLLTNCQRLVDHLLARLLTHLTCCCKLFQQLVDVLQFNNLLTSCEWQFCSNLTNYQLHWPGFVVSKTKKRLSNIFAAYFQRLFKDLWEQSAVDKLQV